MRVTFEKFVFKKKKDAYRVNLEYFVPKMNAIFASPDFSFFFLFKNWMIHLELIITKPKKLICERRMWKTTHDTIFLYKRTEQHTAPRQG